MQHGRRRMLLRLDLDSRHRPRQLGHRGLWLLLGQLRGGSLGGRLLLLLLHLLRHLHLLLLLLLDLHLLLQLAEALLLLLRLVSQLLGLLQLPRLHPLDLYRLLLLHLDLLLLRLLLLRQLALERVLLLRRLALERDAVLHRGRGHPPLRDRLLLCTCSLVLRRRRPSVALWRRREPRALGRHGAAGPDDLLALGGARGLRRIRASELHALRGLDELRLLLRRLSPSPSRLVLGRVLSEKGVVLSEQRRRALLDERRLLAARSAAKAPDGGGRRVVGPSAAGGLSSRTVG